MYKRQIENQTKVLLAILNLTKIGIVEANLELIKESAHTGVMLINKNITEAKEFKLVHQSVTDVYKRQPQGFGGKTTAIGLNIETLPTHIAGMPCAVNINCHVTRHKTEVI